MKHGGAVYMLTNKNHTTLYVGVTSDLQRRLEEHKSKQYPNAFTARYNLDKLVYFELFHRIEEAILKEKQIKGGSRKKKEDLIRSMNPNWQDLREQLSG